VKKQYFVVMAKSLCHLKGAALLDVSCAVQTRFLQESHSPNSGFNRYTCRDTIAVEVHGTESTLSNTDSVQL
jgi:hypothetical protein